MGNYQSFCETVEGYNHKKKGIGCEDSSRNYSDAEGKFYIAVIADGHGDPACTRSKQGSEFAVEAAVDSFKKFVTDIEARADGLSPNLLLHEVYAICSDKDDYLVKLEAEKIINVWKEKVRNDIQKRPLSEKELQQAGAYKNAYSYGKRLEHVYGTTLVAALRVGNCLILIQKGDGRCVVFFEDGTFDQPIPWDDRCIGNITTSMCDEDAADTVQYKVINLDEKDVIACYVGSDGVEDSYTDEEGTYIFYQDLMVIMGDKTEPDNFRQTLADVLTTLSRVGSGDDISVAGIVDWDRIKECIPSFRKTTELYHAKEDLSELEEQVISMERKHENLRKNVDKAQGNYERINSEIGMVDKDIELFKSKMEECQKKCQIAEHEMNELGNFIVRMKRKYNLFSKKRSNPVGLNVPVIQGGNANKFSKMTGFQVCANNNPKNGIEWHKQEEIKWYLSLLESERNKLSEELKLAEKEKNSVKKEYDEYHDRRQERIKERNEMRDKIKAMEKGDMDVQVFRKEELHASKCKCHISQMW